MNDRAFTVRDLCERYGIGEHTVLGWIRSRELRAIDVSRNRRGKPRWRVTPEALEAFELIRTPSPPPPRKRRRKPPADLVEYY